MLSTQRGASGGALSYNSVLVHAKPSTRDGGHEQRHIGANASTVKESGAQGTIRLPRARVKPSQLGRGAHNSFCALNPAWRKRWRTLVNSVLVHAKPSTRDGGHEQRHIEANASTVKESGAQGTIRLPRARVKPSQLGRGAHNSFCALNPAWRKRWRTLVNSVLVHAKPSTRDGDTSSATSKPAPAR